MPARAPTPRRTPIPMPALEPEVRAGLAVELGIRGSEEAFLNAGGLEEVLVGVGGLEVMVVGAGFVVVDFVVDDGIRNRGVDAAAAAVVLVKKTR